MTVRREAVALTNGFGEHLPITVHLNGAISVRNREHAFKGQAFIAYPGDLVFSKIDARNGAIGLVPAHISSAVVTPEFPVLRSDAARLDRRYLALILHAGGFVDALRRKASGTSGRKRITAASFLNLAVPLPPLAEQEALVAAHDAVLASADAQEAEAARIEAEAADAFTGALGLAAPPPLPDRPLLVARFRDMDRWSHEAVLRRSLSAETTAATWPIVRLGDVIADLENG